MPSLLHGQAEVGRHRWTGRALREALRRTQGRQEVTAAPEVGRREVLLRAKCKALVRAQWGEVADRATATLLPGGAAMAADGVAWVLAEDAPERSLGAALIWARRHHVDGGALHLLASGSSGVLARRAAWFERDVTVWSIDGTTVRPAVASPLPTEPEIDGAAEPFRAMFERVGADVVAEGGLLRAEILGLEVARVEPDDAGGGVRLAVGVGKHDREAQREVHGAEQGFDHLFEVVRIVAEHRVVDGEGHAAYHLAPERWLRSIVVRRPELVGAKSLHPVPSPVHREDLRQPAPAPATGVDSSGEPMLVVCSVGTDLDLVPATVDAWLADGRWPRLVICIPEVDAFPMTRALVGSLSPDMRAELVTVPSDWRSQ